MSKADNFNLLQLNFNVNLYERLPTKNEIVFLLIDQSVPKYPLQKLVNASLLNEIINSNILKSLEGCS